MKRWAEISVREILDSVEEFRGLDTKIVDDIADCCVKEPDKIEPDTPLIEQGKMPSHGVIIVSGVVERRRDDGRQVLTYSGPTTCIGEISLALNLPHYYTTITRSYCYIMQILPPFREVVDEHRSLDRQLFVKTLENFYHEQYRYERLLRLDAPARVIESLLSLCIALEKKIIEDDLTLQTNKDGKRSSYPFPLNHATQRSLAIQHGLASGTVSTILEKLKTGLWVGGKLQGSLVNEGTTGGNPLRLLEGSYDAFQQWLIEQDQAAREKQEDLMTEAQKEAAARPPSPFYVPPV